MFLPGTLKSSVSERRVHSTPAVVIPNLFRDRTHGGIGSQEGLGARSSTPTGSPDKKNRHRSVTLSPDRCLRAISIGCVLFRRMTQCRLRHPAAREAA